MRKLIKKIGVALLIAVFFLNFASPIAYAESTSIANPQDAAKKAMQGIMSMFGADQKEMTNAVQTMNNYRQKKIPPQVALAFTPNTPTPGQKMTATAAPSYFMNDASKMYYTWYLKHSYCKTKDVESSDSEKQKACDLNKDDTVDVEDYKIEAMRIMVNGGFDWEKADYSDWDNDSDKDGYEAIQGGDDQRGKEGHCFVHNVKSGNEYEIDCGHLFPDANITDERIGDGEFNRREEKFWHTDPTSADTAGQGTVDEATIMGVGKTSFDWIYQEGDKVGVVIEGVSVEATQEADASYKTMWAMPKGICENKNGTEIVDDVPLTGKSTSTTEDYDADNLDKIVTETTITITKDSDTEYTKVTDSYIKRYRALTSGDDDDGNPIVTGYGSKPYSTTHPSTITETKIVDGSETSVTRDNPLSETIGSVPDRITEAKDLNRCLEANLIAPAEGNANKKLQVDLSYSPESPINDISSSGNNSDTLIVQSSILNADNKEFMNYAWQVSLGDSIGTDNWKELTKSDLTEQTGIKQTAGMGLRDIKLRLNFKKDFLSELGLTSTETFYAKVKLTAKENARGGIKKEGIGTIIIPIHLSSSKIQVFSALVSESLDITLDSRERCNMGASDIVCPVAKDEIVGVKSDFDPKKYTLLWTLDGEPLSFQGDCTSLSCDSDQNYSNTNFFPILKGKGHRYTVNLIADNKETGEKTTLTKIFEVSDPAVSIASADENTCKAILLGNYIDLDERLWPDYSEDAFEALQGTTVKLKPLFNTPYYAPYTWFFDGVAVTNNNAAELGISIDPDGTLSFIADKRIGENYTVGIGTIYTQSNLVKKALNKHWGVSLKGFYEKQIGTSVDIAVTDILSGSFASSVPAAKQKILASLFSAVPSYVNFLFRVLLTMTLILFGTGILFSLFPKQIQE